MRRQHAMLRGGAGHPVVEYDPGIHVVRHLDAADGAATNRHALYPLHGVVTRPAHLRVRQLEAAATALASCVCERAVRRGSALHGSVCLL